MKNCLMGIWNWHGIIGKALTMTIIILFIGAAIGLPFGATKCQKINKGYYTNIFLNEDFMLHDENYIVNVKNAYSLESIEIVNKNKETEILNGNFVCVNILIFQKDDSKLSPHKIDSNDFKLKDHTGVHVPLSDIASMVGWDMIDYRWDQAKNGFVVSSADFETRNSIKDYAYINKVINPGESIDITVYFNMDSKYKVEYEIMVLEIDFFLSVINTSKRMGEDVILLPRPDNLPKELNVDYLTV